MKKTIHVANVIVLNKNGDVLLLKRSQNLKQPGFLGLPGGLIDKNESPQNAVIRELKEETRIIDDKFVISESKKFIIEKTDEDVEIITFLANLVDTVSISLDPYEHSDYQWVIPEKLSQVENLLPGIPTMLNSFLDLEELTTMVEAESSIISYVP